MTGLPKNFIRNIDRSGSPQTTAPVEFTVFIPRVNKGDVSHIAVLMEEHLLLLLQGLDSLDEDTLPAWQIDYREKKTFSERET